MKRIFGRANNAQPVDDEVVAWEMAHVEDKYRKNVISFDVVSAKNLSANPIIRSIERVLAAPTDNPLTRRLEARLYARDNIRSASRVAEETAAKIKSWTAIQADVRVQDLYRKLEDTAAKRNPGIASIVSNFAKLEGHEAYVYSVNTYDVHRPESADTLLEGDGRFAVAAAALAVGVRSDESRMILETTLGRGLRADWTTPRGIQQAVYELAGLDEIASEYDNPDFTAATVADRPDQTVSTELGFSLAERHRVSSSYGYFRGTDYSELYFVADPAVDLIKH